MLSPVYSADAIQSRIKDLADEINKDFKDTSCLHLVVTLTGAFVFAADLIRLLKVPVTVNFAGSQTFKSKGSRDLRIDETSIPLSFAGEPVLIIEDILAKGETIDSLRTMLAERFTGQIKVATLLKRQDTKKKADYCGFTVPADMFVVGYGMDMDGRYRQLADIKAVMNAMAGGLC